jgi:hypothetical protein
MYQILCSFSLAEVIYAKNLSKSEAPCDIQKRLVLCGEKWLTPCPTPKLEDHPLSAGLDCLFNIFTATFHIWRLFTLSAT